MRKEIFICALVFLTLATVVSATSSTLVIDGMEDVSRWGVATGSETKLSVTADSTYVKEGSKSLKLEYSGSTKVCKECYGRIKFYRKEFSEWENYEGITFWVYKPEDKIEVEVLVDFVEKTPDGKKSIYRTFRYLRTKGWHRIEVPFTNFVWHPKSNIRLPFDLGNFNSFNIKFQSEAPSFTVYIDDLKLYGPLPPATTPAPTTITPIVVSRKEVVDTDGDGWSDELENRIGTNPNNPDTDGDGIIDSKDPNPLKYGGEVGKDSDGDGWSDELEKKAETNPFNKDTDGDGIWDSKDPNPLRPEGEKNEIDWEQIGVVLLVIGTIVGWFLSQRKRKIVKSLLDDIDETFTSFKMNALRCESELLSHRDIVLDHLKRGKITEESYNILDKRIDNYLGEIRKRIMEEGFGKVPARLKDEVHRMLEDGEISEDEYAAFENILGKSKGIGKKEKSELKDLFKKWKDEDKITGYVLEKSIDEYMKDIGKVEGKVSGMELNAEIDKIMKDGIVTQEEYEEFSKMLEKSDLAEKERDDLKRKLEKIKDITSGSS